MTSQPLSTRRRTDAQPTTHLARPTGLAAELLALAATLTLALAAAWVLTQPLLGLATLAGLALLLAVAHLAPWPRPNRGGRLAALAGR